MLQKILSFTLFLWMISYSCLAQIDSNYVEIFNQELALSYFLSTRNMSLTLSPKSTDHLPFDANSTDYKPNVKEVIGFGFFYRNIGLNVGFKVPASLNNVTKYGKSSYRDLSLHYLKHKVVADLYYQNYKGFADYNTPLNDPNPPENGILNLRPDIHLGYLKAKVMYIPKGDRYSHRAAFKFVERQRKSAGSPIFISHAYFLTVSADSALLPREFRRNFEEFQDLRKYEVGGLGIGLGYAHTFVLSHKFFATPLFAIGADFQHQTYFLDQQENQRVSVSPLTDIRFSLGYNGDRLFIVTTFISDLTAVHFPKLATDSQYLRVNFTIGYRFKAPRFLKKAREALPGA